MTPRVLKMFPTLRLMMALVEHRFVFHRGSTLTISISIFMAWIILFIAPTVRYDLLRMSILPLVSRR